MRLTERACRDLARTADVAGRPFRRDDGVPGFGLRRRSLAELPAPAADALVSQRDAPLGQDQLDVSEAQVLR